MPGIEDHIKTVLAAAPELIHSPGLVVELAQAASAGAGDPHALAQVAAHAAVVAGTVAVQQQIADAGTNGG